MRHASSFLHLYNYNLGKKEKSPEFDVGKKIGKKIGKAEEIGYFCVRKKIKAMIARKLDKFIDDFYSSSNKALLLTGARQVGKTEAFRSFARRTYKNYVEINFLENPAAKTIFDAPKSAEEILLRLSVFTDVSLINGDTFILFDEIQECKECITQIKFLVQDGRYAYGLTGSLLGVELNDVRSEPVGFMDVKEVFPLDLEEFATAIGVSEKVIDYIRDCYENRKPVDHVVHSQMISVFNLYVVVGGMPAAVWKYIQEKNMQPVLAEQRAIINIYKRDIAKYDKQDKLYIDEIFSLIPSELNSRNKRFILKKLNENAKFNMFENSFLWLTKAGVAIPVYNVEEPRVPLLLNKQRNLLKLFQNDVGLLTYQYADGIQLKLLSGQVNINYGAVYENVVAQELLAHGFKQLYYFNNKRQGEVDFVLERGDGSVLPVEVKSGKDYAIHLALNNIMGNSEYGIPEAIVLCNDNVKTEGKITYLPIYMVMFIQKTQETGVGEYVPDISALIG